MSYSDILGIIPRNIAPHWSNINTQIGDISGVILGDNKITFQFRQTDISNISVGSKYRMQYTNNPNYWYYPTNQTSGLPIETEPTWNISYSLNITYIIGAGGVGGINTGNGSSGGTTTLIINGIVLTAYGGTGGYYNDNVIAAGGNASGGTSNVSGGYGTGSSSENGGGAGGSINGGVGIKGGISGDDASNVVDYQGLSDALTGQPDYFLGIGGLRSSTNNRDTININNGRTGIGIGAGGGGAGSYGGNGGAGSYGGGGGGASGYSGQQIGGVGGGGIIIIRINNTSTIVLTSGSSYTIDNWDGALLKIWVIGAGGGGAGSQATNSCAGGGGGGGGMVYYNVVVQENFKLPAIKKTTIIRNEYDILYDSMLQKNTGVYSIDVVNKIFNGTRYYFRYCIVNADGDCSPYTISNSSNYSITSTIPGKIPEPPDIFNAIAGDRSVSLYFSWKSFPPGIDKTGGYPILDYKIDRYIVITDNNGNTTESFDIAINNIVGPFYQDTNITRNGILYKYLVYSRNSIGYSLRHNYITSCPIQQCDVVNNVFSTVNNNQITLLWTPPNNININTPIVQYYIQYRIFDISNDGPLVPPQNLQGSLTISSTIRRNIDDMNSILVDDTLWAKLTTPIRSIYTNSTTPSYTINDLVNGEAYVFRIGAVTQNILGYNLIGYMQNFTGRTPYLLHPIIIGKVPIKIRLEDDLYFTNDNENININWSSNDMFNNNEKINNFIIAYRIYDTDISNSVIIKYNYDSCVIRYDDNLQRIYFNISITGLSNNVPSRPNTNSHSYDITLYAENTIGYTNEYDRVNLNILFDPSTNPLYDNYYNLPIARYIRPRSIPNVPY